MNTEVESGAAEPVAPTSAPAAAAQETQTESAATNNAAATENESWEQLGVRDDLRDTLLEIGFLHPMPVQRAVYPRMMAGKDVMVQSRTGSGKTAAFGIPFAQGLIDGEKKEVQALVLAPTRELALQVGIECEKIAAKRLHVVPVYGGAPMGKQIDALKAGAQVVAGTPGRVLDHLWRGTLKLDNLRVLVLDEADEMLSMGFLEEITEIIKRCPTQRQTVLFSATIPDDIERIGSRYMREPEKIELSAGYIGVHEIKHSYYMVSGMGRARDLVRVLDVEKPDSAIIFCNTREDTALVAEFLRKSGMDAEAISSDLTQKDRERVMGRMKDKNLHYLVATDIAARGIDISDLSHVINYTFPESAEVYVHRTGRTGRAGKSGVAISLISPRELGNFYMLKLTYKIKPEERQLPSDEHLKTQREAARVDELREKIGARQPADAYRQLAKRVWAAEDGERLVAALIEDKLTAKATTPMIEAAKAQQPARSQAPRAASPDLEPAPSAGPTGGFSAPPAAQQQAPAQPKRTNGTGEEPKEGEERQRRRRRRGSRGGSEGREPREARPAAQPKRVAETIDASDGKEFWEAWVDSKAEPAPMDIAASPTEETRVDRPREEPLPEGQVRLYLNLGRRDGAREAEVETLLKERNLEGCTIQVRNSHTYLIVADEKAEGIITGLTGGKYGERDIVCERARK